MATFEIDPEGGTGTDQPDSFLKGLREELQKDARIKNVTYDVNTRSKVSVEYDPNLEARTLDLWRKKATKHAGSAREDFDFLRFSEQVLIATCVAIKYSGQTVLGDNGDPLDFRGDAIREYTGALDQYTAVQMFFGVDSHMIGHATRVLEEAGYGPEGQEVTEGGDSPLN